MTRRPPRSTLFPTRRSSDLPARGATGEQGAEHRPALRDEARAAGRQRIGLEHRVDRKRQRSEEHTSELQSRRDLVCRLLLEKKKRNKSVNYYNAESTSWADR